MNMKLSCNAPISTGDFRQRGRKDFNVFNCVRDGELVVSAWTAHLSLVSRSCGECLLRMRRITIRRALTWHYRKMHPCVEQSSGMGQIVTIPILSGLHHQYVRM